MATARRSAVLLSWEDDLEKFDAVPLVRCVRFHDCILTACSHFSECSQDRYSDHESTFSAAMVDDPGVKPPTPP